MSSIDDLVREHCPDGVPYLALSEVTARGANIRWASVGDAEFRYIDLASVDRVTRKIGDTATVVAGSAPSRALQIVGAGDVIFATTRPTQMRWAVIPAEYDGQIASTGFCVLRPIQGRVLTNFLAHLLGAERFRRYIEEKQVPGNYPSIPDSLVRGFRIPVPPLEVQREIVRVLDHFTELESVLEAELEAELEARRVQYAYYRSRILTPAPDWRTATVGEVADVFDGPHATPKKTASGPWYLSISSLKDGSVDLAESAHLAPDDLPAWTRRVAPQVGDTLFSYETRIGQAAYWDRSEPAALGRRMGLLRPKAGAVDPKYLTIAYLSPAFQAHLARKTVRGSTVERISIADLPNWPIVLPPRAEQHAIVALIDKFDALVNDLSVGLPAELAARRRQYEYYRDRLLTFEEAVA